MDLELTDEQTLAQRGADDPAGARVAAPPKRRTRRRRESATRLWAALVEFGRCRGRRRGPRGGRAVPRGARARRAPGVDAVPRQRRAALRGRAVPGDLPAAFGDLGEDRVSVALLEPGRSWSVEGTSTLLGVGGLEAARWRSSTPARSTASPSSRRRGRDRRWRSSRRGAASANGAAASLDVTSRCTPSRSPAPSRRVVEGDHAAAMLARLTAIGALLAAAESVGAAEPDARRRARLRRRAPPVRPHDRQLPGAAPHPGRHVRAPGQRLVDRALRRRRARRRVCPTPSGRRRSPRRTWRAPRARSRTARCRSSAASRSPRSIRRTASCGGSSCASSSSATPRTTSASSAGRSRSSAMERRMTETGFNDPTAQRLERITTGADPEVVGPLLADVLHDPRWLRLRRRADLRWQVEPDLSRRLRRRRGHPAPPAARSHPADRARHGPRVPRAHRARRHRRPRAADPAPRRRRALGAPFYVMERVLGHICRNALPHGYAEDAGRAARDRRGARRRARRAAHRRPGRRSGWPSSAGPAGFMARQLRRWSQQWEASRVEDVPALDALRDELVRTLPPSASTRSCTATSGSTTPSCTPPGPAASWPSSTGR